MNDGSLTMKPGVFAFAVIAVVAVVSGSGCMTRSTSSPPEAVGTDERLDISRSAAPFGPANETATGLAPPEPVEPREEQPEKADEAEAEPEPGAGAAKAR